MDVNSSVELAVKVAGSCVLLWFTGYAFGRVYRTVVVLFRKASR